LYTRLYATPVAITSGNASRLQGKLAAPLRLQALQAERTQPTITQIGSIQQTIAGLGRQQTAAQGMVDLAIQRQLASEQVHTDFLAGEQIQLLAG